MLVAARVQKMVVMAMAARAEVAQSAREAGDARLLQGEVGGGAAEVAEVAKGLVGEVVAEATSHWSQAISHMRRIRTRRRRLPLPPPLRHRLSCVLRTFTWRLEARSKNTYVV